MHEFQGPRSPSNLISFLERYHGKASLQEAQQKIVLRSLEWRAASEPVRMILKDLGLEFEDIRYSEEQWDEVKDGLQQLNQAPFGELPSLSVGNFTVSTTSAVLRHLARRFNLYGETEVRVLCIYAFVALGARQMKK